MSENINRRRFLKKTVTASAVVTLGLNSFEEKNLLATAAEKKAASKPETPVKGLPMGKIGNVKISRLICGGNLISGFAHSRDLIYASSLIKNYFTDDKIMETLQICEENGVNTAILRVDKHSTRILNKYWKERGGKIQWLAQVKIRGNDVLSDTKKAIDNGAVGVYLQGNCGDKLTKTGRIILAGNLLEFAKKNNVIAGIGSHSIEVPMECEMLELKPDFYMKTLHDHSYWSCTPEQVPDPYELPPFDNMWSTTPTKTIEFMKTVKRPWIAFKVLAAGAIYPQKGFRFAFEGGADFVCVGMFDFQVKDDVAIAKNITANITRTRPWMG